VSRGRPLRVLTVTNMYPAPQRPVHGTFVAEEVTSLRRRGIDVDVLFIDGPASKLNYARGVGQVRRAVASKTDGVHRYDLIHAHYVFSGIIALAQRRLPVVLTQHGIETQEGWTAPLSRWTSRRVAFTVATSARVAEALRTPRMTVLPCGVDTGLFCPMPRSEARRALGLPEDNPIVLFVGAPRPEKRLPLIQSAVDLLRREVPDAQLLVVTDEPRARIPLYMNAANVLALASVAEGSPMVVREALACDLPVVSTDVGDVTSLTEDLPGCYIATPEPVDFAARLRLSLQQGQRCGGRARILPWSLDEVAARLESIYCEVRDRWSSQAAPTGMTR
jgi:teichuronic acid biosynthesis glycosyltransferase TuaC